MTGSALHAPRQLPLAGAYCRALRHDPTRICGSLAAVHATLGCIHEHIFDKVPICQWCIEPLAEGHGSCRACETCSNPHECEVSVIRIEDLT